MMQEAVAFTPQVDASSIARWLWLIPALPIFAAGIISVLKQPRRKLASSLAIGSLGISFLIAITAFAHVLNGWSHGYAVREVVNFSWLTVGTQAVELGWVLDPLSAVMLVMVTFVGLLIFIYSTGYMEHDENYTRFFCFLALFAGAMLGVVIANSILLLFMCWELVGLTSYLLIGFWYFKPSAAAAARKAFITTRVGDIFFLLGIVWLFAQTGTLLFYDHGAGSIETLALGGLLVHQSHWGITAAGAIGLLIFAGAAGKSGQLPLHVWLPDAMEGPTPVSALIHAATMVAAGVYLIARVYPLMSAGAIAHGEAPGTTTALMVVTWVGASTALFAALIAVAQNDIKRILAYSTVSQLGYMMAGLGVGGVAVGMFHLITHAFFKALLFMGSGSVIHGVHEEQDIRRMGGLRKSMPITFITYAVGMLALCGVPIFFSGFWSKDAILESAHGWPLSRAPYYMLVFGAVLTAFYMTRQVSYVFFGQYRGHSHPHESPRVMTTPLAILAVSAVALGVIGTPAWPWFRAFLENHPAYVEMHAFAEPAWLMLLLTSFVIVILGIGHGWWLYGNKSPRAEEPDALEKAMPPVWIVLANRLYIDELYGATVIAFYYWWAKVADWIDREIWGDIVATITLTFKGWARLNKFLDANMVDGAFDKGCEEIYNGGGVLARIQNGRGQIYLRLLAVAVVILAAILIWSGRP
ncbi:NADH-quinone oxidoreductase subunit L [Occallatibacter savannae]|uniref:NADH-quinone oxidoreductase subunit L n=1 Tax=Occallatibacter savannae TaxID=1002691 RepID=UPI001EF48E61|nr:NADH-quinone oxidoreductase subunit L [Occallatibacter savannae]